MSQRDGYNESGEFIENGEFGKIGVNGPKVGYHPGGQFLKMMNLVKVQIRRNFANDLKGRQKVEFPGSERKSLAQ